MAINLRCDCGRKLKLRDNLAGKKIRCPDCGETLPVPEADEDVFESSSYDELDDDYDTAPPRRASRSQDSGSRSSRGRGRTPAKKSTNTGLIIGLVVAAVMLLGLVGAGVALVVGNKGRDVAQNPIPNQPPPFQQNPGITPPTGIDLNAGNLGQVNNPLPVPPINNPAAPAIPVVNGPGNDVWVVLSNFRQAQQPGRGPFGSPYSVDYRVVSGQADPTKKYVLYVRNPSPGGIIEHYLEVDVPLQQSGTVTFTPGPAFGGGSTSFQASIAYRKGVREREKVSAEIAVGGPETAATPPPSVQQLAGAAAQGKVVAIANGKMDRGIGGLPTLTVDYVVQSPPAAGFYFLVAKTASGEGFEFDVTHDLRLAKQGDKATLGGRLVGPGTNGPFTLHIEKRMAPISSPFRKETPEIVSNSIATQ